MSGCTARPAVPPAPRARLGQEFGKQRVRLFHFIKEEPLLGHGTGDGDIQLISTYEKMRFTIGATDRYNAHNMYLQYWLTNGFITAFIFIGILQLLFRSAIRNKNWVFFSFVLLFAAFSVTESTMLRQNGIVFFLVISSLFYWSPKLWDESQEPV